MRGSVWIDLRFIDLLRFLALKNRIGSYQNNNPRSTSRRREIMEETRFAAGNITFAVRELHTRLGDGVSVDILAGKSDQEVSVIRLDWFPDCPHYHYNPKT